jgi:hypothetical protein
MQAKTTQRELAQRAGDGVEVALLWNQGNNRLTVAVADTRTGHEFELSAHPENALDVFYHPFAYAAFQRRDYRIETAASPASAEALAA